MWKSRARCFQSRFAVAILLFISLVNPVHGQETIHPIPAASANHAAPAADPTQGRLTLPQRTALFSQHARAGINAYKNEKWDIAIAEYQAAYSINQNPKLLFNIAQAYRKAGLPQEALEYYEHFRRDAPGNPLALEAAAQSAAMRAQLDILRLDSMRTQAEQDARDKAEEAARLAQVNAELRRQVDDALSAGELVKQRPSNRRALSWGLLAGGATIALGLGLGLGLGLSQPEPPIEPGLGVLNVTFQ